MNDDEAAFFFSGHRLDYGANGMSLRDWFAGQALAAVVSNPEHYDILPPRVAETCYTFADAMIKQREQKGSGQ